MSSQLHNLGGQPHHSGQLLGGLLAGLIVLLTSTTAFAWNFSCGNTQSNSFEKQQPQAYIMLDESGSMGSDTTISQCNRCDYQANGIIDYDYGSIWYDHGGDTESTTFQNVSSCSTMNVGTSGDFNGNSEYLDLSAESQSIDRLCDSGECDQCGYTDHGTYDVPGSALSDGDLTVTGQTSSQVNYCSYNYTYLRLNEYGSGTGYSGSFDCPACSSASDCARQVGVPQCALQSISHSSYSCNSTRSKWDVATSSVRSVVGDMTNSDPDAAEFGIGFFESSARNGVTPQENAYSQIDSEISSAGPLGGTNIEEAIHESEQALSSASSSDRVKASILITDGQHNAFGSTDLDVLDAACQHRNNQGNLFVVGFGSGPDEQFNEAIAAAGGSGTCCLPGTGNCSATSSDYVDPCSVSDTQLQSWNDGRDLDCRGAYQAQNGTGLKNAINGIASDLACTVDVSSMGSGKWKDSYYDCAPGYDCFDVEIDGLNERIYHEDSSNSPNGWKWSDPARQNNIVLDSYWCNRVKNLQNNNVETELACMCNETKGASCQYSNANTCECGQGTWTCSQGTDNCSQLSAGNCPVALEGEGDPCTAGQGVCRNEGVTQCQNGSPSCSATADTSQKQPETCDGRDNNCDGIVDGGSEITYTTGFEGSGNGWNSYYDFSVSQGARTSPSVEQDWTYNPNSGSESGYAHAPRGACGHAGLSRTFRLSENPESVSMYLRADVDNWGRVAVVLQDLSTGTYHTLWRKKGSGSGYSQGWQRVELDLTGFSRNFRLIVGNDDRSTSWCDMWDHGWKIWVDDLSLRVDSPSTSLTRTTNCTSLPGRCSQGRQVCQNGSWNGCDQLKQPIAETCNGIDDDCDGLVDEGLTRVTNCTGKPGRCSEGRQTCNNGSWTGCTQVREPMPEICNGLDDDCSGIPDDISSSWSSQNWNVDVDGQYKGIACGKMNSCVCGPGDADASHRGNQSNYSSLDAEFDDMVSSTNTGCVCQE
jgi:hypothetical protein